MVVVISVISKNTILRRRAARTQAMGRLAGASASSPPPLRPVRDISTAVPMLFQKPRQGTGTIEPRWMGGAVTALGCRSARKVLRAEMGVGWVFMAGFSANPMPA